MANLKVKIAELMKPLRTLSAKPGITLGAFLEEKEMKFGASFKVNGESKPKSYHLRNGDVIIVVGEVNGG